MPLNSHRRYQKVCISNVNHERGYQFEHILAPTLPDFKNKLRELRQWTPLAAKVHRIICLSLAMHALCN